MIRGNKTLSPTEKTLQARDSAVLDEASSSDSPSDPLLPPTPSSTNHLPSPGPGCPPDEAYFQACHEWTLKYANVKRVYSQLTSDFWHLLLWTDPVLAKFSQLVHTALEESLELLSRSYPQLAARLQERKVAWLIGASFMSQWKELLSLTRHVEILQAEWLGRRSLEKRISVMAISPHVNRPDSWRKAYGERPAEAAFEPVWRQLLWFTNPQLVISSQAARSLQKKAA